MLKNALAGAMAFALMGCNSVDPGGLVMQYRIEVAASKYEPTKPIAQTCNSACNLRLSGNYCVRKDGVFGVHASRWGFDGPPVSPRDNQVRQHVPACFRNLADRYRAWDSLAYTNIPAGEVLAACPHLTACAA